MHPWTARRLISSMSKGKDVVLDPFCGSGTVVLEARLAGRVTQGSDVHPLAVRLAMLKASTPHPRLPKDLAAAASRVAGRALATARRWRGERIPGFESARAFWQPHVARDLLALQATVAETPAGLVRDALWLVLSSLAVKVSDRASDTESHQVEKQIAAGAATKLFAAKARELAERLSALSRAAPKGTPQPIVTAQDARKRSERPDASVDLVVTSPPYPGTYDYADHHAMRVWLLGIDASSAAAAEIGARRRGGRGWREGLAAALVEIARVLRPGGRAVLLVGDGVEADRPVDAAEAIKELAIPAGLRWLATASQERPTFSSQERRMLGPTKKESLVALER